MTSSTKKSAYSLRELLELVPLSKSSIYGQIKAGRLRAAKCGRRTIFMIGDVEQWLDGMRREPRQ
jgi:predicted DNA-binding transcriptional regulator AlpA